MIPNKIKVYRGVDVTFCFQNQDKNKTSIK
jgi:hypothetical protein